MRKGKHAPGPRLELAPAKIMVDALTMADAEGFVVGYLGVPRGRIDHTEDAGVVDRPERYKPGTRCWHVYLKPDLRLIRGGAKAGGK